MTDQVKVTQADVQRKLRWQQRFLTERIGESELLDEEFARHRIAAQAETRSQVEQRFWAIVDPNAVPSDMWEALNRMAKAYRTQTER